MQSQATTQIYRIAVEGTNMVLAAQGEVDGTLLNQFALDEHGDRLRVATTTASSEPANSVHVLDLELKEVGSTGRHRPGRADLFQPIPGRPAVPGDLPAGGPVVRHRPHHRLPAVLGELKVPGASTYLQMVDEGLLGIGFENGSVKVSLYDVTDPRASRRGEQLLWWKASPTPPPSMITMPCCTIRATDLLVIPITSYGGWTRDSWIYYQPWSAALVLSLGPDGIAQVGSIVHDNATVERSLYIGDVLYTISDTTVKANSLPTLCADGRAGLLRRSAVTTMAGPAPPSR